MRRLSSTKPKSPAPATQQGQQDKAPGPVAQQGQQEPQQQQEDNQMKTILERLSKLEDTVKTLQEEMKILKQENLQLSEGTVTEGNTGPAQPPAQFDFFISLNVASSLKIAEALKSFLQDRYKGKVFLCTEMAGGASFRDQIVDALESCKVFIPLINSEWIDSPECLDEFNHARRLNLISHKIGKTHPPETRIPVILPVYFDGFNFLLYKETRLLASSVNFLPLVPAHPDDTWNRIYSSVAYLHPPGLENPVVTSNPASELDEKTKTGMNNLKNEVGDDLLVGGGGGTFVLSGKTVNSYDGNTTLTERCLITFSGGKVTGTIDYKAGTLYNDSDIAPIEGTYDLASLKTHWTEIYHHGSSHFVYDGKIEHNKIVGTYFWQEKPSAVGTFEFFLERWL